MARTDFGGLTRRECRYGDHAEQVADLWMPEYGTYRRLVFLVHGGGFARHFDRTLMAAAAADLTRRGFAVWNTEYRRTGCGGGPLTSPVDVVSSLERMCSELRPSRRPLVLGHSAGGYLALRMTRLPVVAGVIALGAVCDLRANAMVPDDEYARFMGGLPGEVPDLYRAADLMTSPGTACPQFLLWGENEQPHRIAENQRLADAVREARGRVTEEEIPATGHFGFLDPRSLAWRRVIGWLEEMHTHELEETLGREEEQCTRRTTAEPQSSAPG